MTPYLPRYRSDEGREAYRAAYRCTLLEWPKAPRSIEVNTQFGMTYVNQLGDWNAPPLVMMHGFGFSSMQWYPNAPVLAQDFCVYMPDVPDQFGLSELSKPLQTPENYALWISELLDGLNIAAAPFIGHSYGGWLSTNFAIRSPKRVTRLTLISPAATFVPLSWQFYARGILGGTTHNDSIIYNMVKWMTTLEQVRGLAVVEQFKTGFKTMAQLPAGFPTVFSEDELGSLQMPVQLIIGDHEVVYAKSPADVIEIARQRIPGLQVVSIRDGGHAVTLDQPSATNAALKSFHMPSPIATETY